MRHRKAGIYERTTVGGDSAKNANGQVDFIWADAIGDCLVIAVRGSAPDGAQGCCFEHLHSRQYMAPGCGG